MEKAINTDQVRKEVQELKTFNNKTSKFKNNKLLQKNTEKEMVRCTNNKEEKMLKRKDKTTRKVMEKTKTGRSKKILKWEEKVKKD